MLSPGTGVAVAGDLLTAFSIVANAPSYLLGSRVGYISLAGPSPTLLGPATPYTDLDPNHVCQNAAYFETIKDARPFQVGGNYYASLSLAVDAMVVGIDASCMSTTPVPNFAVTATTPTAAGPVATAATCQGAATSPSTGVAAVGFPGDTFTIADQSAGAIADGTLVITPTTSGVQSWSEASADAWQPPQLAWQSPPGGPPGEYQVAMTLRDATGAPFPLTKSIYLCSTPQAKITITKVNDQPCSGDRLHLPGERQGDVLGGAGHLGGHADQLDLVPESGGVARMHGRNVRLVCAVQRRAVHRGRGRRLRFSGVRRRLVRKPHRDEQR